MNASPNVRNPYIAGPPVYGKDFYGRSSELREVLDGTKKFIWFISTRRMGKTSLLRQIAYLCQHEPKYNDQYRCLYWDLQGLQDNPNFERLRKKLTLRPNQPLIPEIDFTSLESNLSCAQVIELCTDTVYGEGLMLLLLIDAPPVFLDLAEKGETDFLDELHDSLQPQGIRTVITGTYRLDRLASMNQFLAQFERSFISPFNRKEGKALICQMNIFDRPPRFVRDEEVIKEILDKANNSPFYIQKICSYLYPDKDITQVWDKIFDLREFDPYFASDFSGLDDAEKAILYFMINKEEKDLPASEILRGAKELMVEGIEPIPTRRRIDGMTSLNIVRHEDDKYYIANSLFRSWLIRNKANLFQVIIRRTNLPSTPPTEIIVMGDDILEIKAEIIALMKVLNDMAQDYERGGIDPARYYKMRLNYLKKLEIGKLKNILRGKGAGALAGVVENLPASRDDQGLGTDLVRAAKEGESEGWGDIIHEAIEKEKGPIDQTILKAAIEVAKFFV